MLQMHLSNNIFLTFTKRYNSREKYRIRIDGTYHDIPKQKSFYYVAISILIYNVYHRSHNNMLKSIFNILNLIGI